MNELEFLKKRKGMTIGTAWMLAISTICLLLFFIVALIVWERISGDSFEKIIDEYLTEILFLVFLSGSLFGVLGINKQIPSFKKPKKSSVFLVILVGLSWILFSTIFDEFAKMFNYIDVNKKENFTHKRWTTGLIVNLSFVFFHIGVIGHGLFKNYSFNKCLVTIFLTGFVFVVPHVAVPMAFEGLMLATIYFAFGSFQLVIFCSVFTSIPEYIFWYFYGVGYNNPIRNNWIMNDTIYVFMVAFSGLTWLYLLFRLYKNRYDIDWNHTPTYEKITF